MERWKAYAYRGIRKSLNGIGLGLGIGSSILKTALSDYVRAGWAAVSDREGDGEPDIVLEDDETGETMAFDIEEPGDADVE